jgi:hypothetical protein
MKIQQKEPWQIVAARFCVHNSEKGFTKLELENFVKSQYEVSEGHINQFWEEEIYLPTGRNYSRVSRGNNANWIPPLDLVSKVTDYEELKEARRNSKNAFWLSIIAIIISAVTLVVTAIPAYSEIVGKW